MPYLPLPLQLLVLCLVGWVSRHQHAALLYLQEENRVLREQLGERRLRLTAAQRRRLAAKGQILGRKLLAEVATLVTPETILRWYRTLVAAKYDGTASRSTRAGRPPQTAEVEALIAQVARENPRFGYTRIRDVMAELGHELSRSTVRRILLEHGLEPAPERQRRPRWRDFLRAHWGAIAAADFFTVEVLTWRGLVRYQVFFVIDLATRRVEIAGLTPAATGVWLQQVGRNLLDPEDGFLRRARFLILDRDPLYTAAFRRLLEESGVHVVRLPRCSPNLNAYAERFVRSIREECLARIVPLGERHLRHAIAEYLAHYNHERHHQGLGGRLIDPDETAGRTRGRVQCRQRLGGLLRYYYRAA